MGRDYVGRCRKLSIVREIGSLGWKGRSRGGLPALRGVPMDAPMADVRSEFDRFFDGWKCGDRVKGTKWTL